MRIFGWILAGLGLLGLFGMVWRDGLGAPPAFLRGLPDAEVEAAYCLAVAERIREITGGHGPPGMERHLDEEIAFWRLRAGRALGKGRAALGRELAAPGINEGAWLDVAVQDCALRAIGFYGQRFPALEAAGAGT